MPLPQGYTLDQPAPKLPAGYTLDAPAPKPQSPAPAKDDGYIRAASPSFMDRLTEIRPDDSRDSIAQRAVNFGGNIGAGGLNLIRHPIDTVGGMVKSLTPAPIEKKVFGTYTPNPVESLYEGANTRPLDTLATNLGATAVTAGAGKVLPPVLENMGVRMQDAGAGVINRTVGSLQKDFKRGADPGRAYLDAGGGPALSMDSLSAKGAALKNATGSKIGAAYDAATKNNVLIPPSKISAAINPPIESARSIINGPGGTGNTAPIDNFEASFRPTLYSRVPVGEPAGLTPNDVFGMKKNVSANTNWSDPTQIGLKRVTQQTAGALGGVLEDAVPGVKPLNEQYQGLTNFANRAALRAQTGSMPLSSIVRRVGEGGTAALLGTATHNPLVATGMGLGGLALESIPVRTTVGTTLYRGGARAVKMGGKLRSLYGK